MKLRMTAKAEAKRGDPHFALSPNIRISMAVQSLNEAKA
jgi:hypothetical protein